MRNHFARHIPISGGVLLSEPFSEFAFVAETLSYIACVSHLIRIVQREVQDKMAAAMKEGMKQKFVNTFVNKLKYKTFGKGTMPDAITPGSMFDLSALKAQAAKAEPTPATRMLQAQL